MTVVIASSWQGESGHVRRYARVRALSWRELTHFAAAAQRAPGGVDDQI
jgi:hypothetical protein